MPQDLFHLLYRLPRVHHSYHYSSLGKENGKEKEERDKQPGEKQRPRIGFGNGARFAIVNPFALQFSHHKTLTSQRKIESRENSFLSLLPNNYNTLTVWVLFVCLFLVPGVSSISSAERAKKEVDVLACGLWILLTQSRDEVLTLSYRESC